MLKITKATKVFNKGTGNEKKALEDLSLTMGPGDFVTVIGSNGAGKSTLLNAICGSCRLDEGAVYLDGQDVTRLADFQRAAVMGRVFQDPMMGTAASMTIEENLALAAKRGERRGLKKAIDLSSRRQMMAALANLQLGLEERLTTPVGLLSGGQRQALTLLMAIYKQPRLLLLDEHTAALDPTTGRKVLELTQEIVGRLNLTTLMVTHNIKDALRIGQRTIMMHEGKIILDIAGAQKQRLTTREILTLFEAKGNGQLDSDRLLLA